MDREDDDDDNIDMGDEENFRDACMFSKSPVSCCERFLCPSLMIIETEDEDDEHMDMGDEENCRDA